MNFLKQNAENLMFCYFLASAVALAIRFGFMDCEHRYIDYVLPVSKIHCKVAP